MRERLQSGKKFLDDSTPTLQAELTRIGDEISAIPLARSASKTTASLPQRIAVLETKIATLATSATQHHTALAADIETSLLVSERKCRALDDLYREANAENEALYERFNEELARIMKGVKGGQGTEEMRKTTAEAQAEAVILRKDVARLRRENVGLRSQLREG